MVWYGMVWYGMVWYGMAWYVWYGMVCMVNQNKANQYYIVENQRYFLSDFEIYVNMGLLSLYLP